MTREEFFKAYKIHPSYYDFFTEERVKTILHILSSIGDDFTPSRDKVFRVFNEDLREKKVLLLGMDPYPQKGVATGFSFEVPYDSWSDKRVNTSLKNILKLIYKSYYGEILDVKSLRAKIEDNLFPILPPNKTFNYWSSQGVLFLNSALTVKIGKPGSHIKLWKDFTEDLLTFISESFNLTYLIWGGKAEKYIPYISKGKIIFHNHPAICGNLKNPNDFLNGTSFIQTKKDINWLYK